jgi:periplasmic divalent cation tolerance protein
MTSLTWLADPTGLAPDQPVVVLTTWPDQVDPVAFVRALVEERLIACGNVLPAMRSIYRWEGAVHDDAEQQLILKTTTAQVPSLLARTSELHPYDVPEFLVIPVVAASTAYLGWLREAVGP